MLKNLLIFSNLLLIIQCQVFWYQPEQVHLAYGSNVYEIVVTWSTFNATDESKVEYGIGGLILEAKGTLKLFVDGGAAKHSQYIHTVTLKNLTPGSRYGKKIEKNLLTILQVRGFPPLVRWFFKALHAIVICQRRC